MKLVEFYIQSSGKHERCRLVADPTRSVWPFVWQMLASQAQLDPSSPWITVDLEVLGKNAYRGVRADLMNQQPSVALWQLGVEDGCTLVVRRDEQRFVKDPSPQEDRVVDDPVVEIVDAEAETAVSVPEVIEVIDIEDTPEPEFTPVKNEPTTSSTPEVDNQEEDEDEDEEETVTVRKRHSHTNIVAPTPDIPEEESEDKSGDEEGSGDEYDERMDDDDDEEEEEQEEDEEDEEDDNEEDDEEADEDTPNTSQEPSPAKALVKPHTFTHRIKIKTDGVYICDYANCNYTHEIWDSLVKHFRKHDPRPGFYCPHKGCNSHTRATNDYEAHILESHNGVRLERVSDKVVVENQRPKQSSCGPPGRAGGWPCIFPLCNETFAARDPMREHSNTHADESGVFHCVVKECTFTGRAPGFINRHYITVHDPSAPNKDAKAHQKSKKRKQVVKAPKKSKNLPPVKINEKGEFVCGYPRCNRAFADEARFKFHMEYYHMPGPYKCSYEGCSESFMKESSLHSHKFHSHKKERLKKIEEKKRLAEKQLGIKRPLEMDSASALKKAKVAPLPTDTVKFVLRDTTGKFKERNYTIMNKTKLIRAFERYAKDEGFEDGLKNYAFKFNGKRVGPLEKAQDLALRTMDVIEMIRA